MLPSAFEFDDGLRKLAVVRDGAGLSGSHALAVLETALADEFTRRRFADWARANLGPLAALVLWAPAGAIRSAPGESLPRLDR